MKTYRIAPGVDAVPLGEDGLLFRSSTLAVKLEGNAAAVFRNQLVQHWSQARTAEELAGFAGVDSAALGEILDSLVRSQVLISSTAGPAAASPLGTLAESLRLDAVEVQTRLRNARVGVFGLEGHGASLAEELCRAGVGSLLLADPFPLRAEDRFLLPQLSAADGVARQSAVGETLRAKYSATAISYAPGKLNRQTVEELASECSALAGCFDRGFEAAQHWVNRAAIATGRPALFVEMGARNFVVGPYVVPGETACYMCYRMRRLACEASYEEAMAHETWLNQGTEPRLASRAIAPFASSVAAGLAAGELMKLLALMLPAALASQILEFDSFTFEQQRHTVLRHPECPVCGQKKKRLPPNPPLADLEVYAAAEPAGDLLAEIPRLVSSRTGTVKHVEVFVKDASEPAVPYVFRADVSNRRFLPHQKDDPEVCSGKGVTVAAAKLSALGEAIERYSGASFSQEEATFARRSELGARSLDPRDLVLFAPAQYKSLPYAPYDDNRLGWVAGRSLSDGGEVLVPAIAAFMNYSVHANEEFLAPITSNGLAAGRTLPEAILSAAGEVLERDAFLLTWFHRLPTRRYSPLHHPDSGVVSIARAHARRGVELRLHQLLPESLFAAFACLALESGSQGPSVVVGLGADLDPVRAARQAVLEVCQVRPALRKRMRRPETQRRLAELLADPREVRTIDDHDLLYASPASRSRLEFLLDVPEWSFAFESPREETPVARLARIAAWLEQQASDLIYVNLTPADMQALGFYTVRAILPQFQPIDFGWAERRLGGSRLYDYPMQAGLRPARATHADLNPDPHPLA